MLTTKQVRAIIKQHSISSRHIFTNKTTGHTGSDRRVKIYFNNDIALLKVLQKAAGKDNITLTKGGDSIYSRGPGLTVKCIIG